MRLERSARASREGRVGQRSARASSSTKPTATATVEQVPPLERARFVAKAVDAVDRTRQPRKTPRENTAERVTRDALALEPEERAALAERLLESLEEHGPAVLSPAWREEFRRRREEIERGEVEAVPAEVVLGRMRAMLA